jgi:hypothetical protein
MHENRETSAVPEVVAGRSGQAQGRTPDMHAAEESDFGVVPVKQPNKGVCAPAEAAEGRPETKENIVQPDTCPTQSGESVRQGLRGVRERARREKKEKFTALLHHLTVDLLRESYFALQRRAAPGIDGETWQQYGHGLEDRLTDLHSRVHRGAYRAKPSRRVYLPKADGRQRPLGIAALEVQHRVADRRILRLIQKWLKAGVMEDGKREETEIGTPQGAVVSPLLANVYLHYVFDLWIDAWRRKIARGQVVAVRYADDLVMGFQYREDAERLLREFQERLGKFGLELHPEKTRLLEFGRFAAIDRRARGERKPETFTFLGFTHLCGQSPRGLFVVWRETANKRMRAKLKQI